MNAIEATKVKLKKFPEIHFRIEGDMLIIPAENENGFDISITENGSEPTVIFGNWHGHFDTTEEAVNFVGFGLTPRCRLREIRRSGVPKKWIVEELDEGKWEMVYVTGTFSLNFLGKKEEVVFQNNRISS